MSSSEAPIVKKKLLDQVRDLIRLKHYAISTERTYIYWIKGYIFFNNKRHPKDMGAEEIKNYLTWLAKDRRVSASTQNQALNAIVFLYKKVLKIEPGDFSSAFRAKKSNYIPEIISRKKILDIIDHSNAIYKLMVILLYGCGLRVSELFRLRVKDIDLEHLMIKIYKSKGGKSRTVMLPECSVDMVKIQLNEIYKIYSADRKNGISGVEMPDRLDKKLPKATYEWGWFWFFPAHNFKPFGLFWI